MNWRPRLDANRPGRWILFDEGREVAEVWPVLRMAAFGDWEYVVGDTRGRERSEAAVKTKVEELLKSHAITHCKIP